MDTCKSLIYSLGSNLSSSHSPIRLKIERSLQNTQTVKKKTKNVKIKYFCMISNTGKIEKWKLFINKLPFVNRSKLLPDGMKLL